MVTLFSTFSTSRRPALPVDFLAVAPDARRVRANVGQMPVQVVIAIQVNETALLKSHKFHYAVVKLLVFVWVEGRRIWGRIMKCFHADDPVIARRRFCVWYLPDISGIQY